MHPTYLRNIARCHQNLGDADKAIASFREYLRKAKGLTAEQRAEIEGYIAEMQQLKRSGAGPAAAPPPAAAAPPPPAAPPPAAAPPPPAALPPDRPAPLVGPPTVVASRPDEADSAPLYARPWFWVGAAVVVAGAVTATILLTADRSPTHGGLGVVDLRQPQ